MERSSFPDIESLLQNLHSKKPLDIRKAAVDELGNLESSDLQIVKALLDVKEFDPDLTVRQEAQEALSARAHQEVLQLHPHLLDKFKAPVPSLQPSRPASSYSFAQPLPWHRTWFKAVTQPRVDTYAELAHDRQASGQRAYTWIFISALLSIFLNMAALAFVTTVLDTDAANAIASLYVSAEPFELDAILTSLVCCGPVAAVIATLLFIFWAAITQASARALDGTGERENLTYALAAFSAPLLIITNTVGPIPVVTYLQIPLLIYQLVLSVIAVKAVNGLSWARSIASTLLPYAVILVVVVVTVLLLLMLIGTSIEDVWQEITVGATSAESAIEHNRQGTIYFYEGELDLAIEEFDKAIKSDPDFADAYNGRGLAYAEKRNFEKAIADFGQAITLDPESVAWFNRGLIYAETGQFERALPDVSRWTEIQPNDPDGYVLRGQLYQMLEEPEKAITDLEKALELDLEPEARQYINDRLQELR